MAECDEVETEERGHEEEEREAQALVTLQPFRVLFVDGEYFLRRGGILEVTNDGRRNMEGSHDYENGRDADEGGEETHP